MVPNIKLFKVVFPDPIEQPDYKEEIELVFKNYPKNFIFLLPSFIESIEIMSKYAHIETKGLVGVLKLKGLLIIYFFTFLIWLNDESDSLERTMTGLDNYFNQIENVLKLFKK